MKRMEGRGWGRGRGRGGIGSMMGGKDRGQVEGRGSAIFYNKYNKGKIKVKCTVKFL